MNRLSVHRNTNSQNRENMSLRDIKKYDEMQGVINRAVSKDSYNYCRKHIPVYGWIKMNYPSTIKPSLYTQLTEKEIQGTDNFFELPQIENINRTSNIVIKYKDEYGEDIILEDKKQWFWPHKRFKSHYREIYEKNPNNK